MAVSKENPLSCSDRGCSSRQVFLLQALLHGDSHSHGGAHHGVVAHAQEALTALPNYLIQLALLSFLVQMLLVCCIACGQSADKNFTTIRFDILIISYLYMKLQGPS